MALPSSPCIPGELANLGFPPLDVWGCGAGAWRGSGGNWGEIYILCPLLGTRGQVLGLLAPLTPATAVGESLELPTGKHPQWNTFICLHPGQGVGRTDLLMSAERLKCGMWTPSKIFARQQRVSRVVGSRLQSQPSKELVSYGSHRINSSFSLRCWASQEAPSAGPGASHPQPGHQELRFSSL